MALATSSRPLKLQKAHPGMNPISQRTFALDFILTSSHCKIKANGGVLVASEKDAEICLVDHLKETPQEGKLLVPSRP